MLQCGLFRSNLALPIAAASYQKEGHDLARKAGAGDGNRTHVASLEGWSSTIELHPPIGRGRASLADPSPRSTAPRNGGGGWIRTTELRRGQIYSLLRLTAPQPLQNSTVRGK